MTTEKEPEGAAKEPEKKTPRPRASRKRTQAAADAKGAGGTGKRTGGKAKSASDKAPSRPRAGGGRRRAQDAVIAAPAVEAGVAITAKSPPRMQARLRDEVAPVLTTELGYTSPMQVPYLTKIIVNIGVGAEAQQNPRAIEAATNDMSQICGQRPVVTRARKSIAAFKLREGMAVGVTVTLRGRRMYEFLDRFISSALPRIRDFSGVPRDAFDGRGNYSVGIREQVVFPEIDYNSIDRLRGLQVVIVTKAKTDREGFRLLELLGMPFERLETAARAA